MKKIFLVLLALVFVFSGCVKSPVLPSENEGSSSSSESEEPSSSSESVPEEKPEPEIFNISIVVDSETLPAEISEAETVSFEVIPKEATKMSGETLEIWEKYIAPIESAMPLSLDFDENNAPHGNIAIYTYIFYQCENLDYKYYGIEKSGYDMAESYLVDGRKTEESIARWFPWNPEDYRQYFEYLPETDQYHIPGCGGGYTYTFIRNYSFDEDILTIDFSIYDGWGEGEYLEVYENHTLKIKIEENGWKYLSNETTFKESIYSPQWHNEDFSKFSSFSTPKLAQEYIGNYLIRNGNKHYNIDINGPRGHKMYFGENSYCFFLSLNGLYFYRFETDEFIHISKLPSEYNKTHMIRNAWIDNSGHIILSYNVLSNNPEQVTVEIAVLDEESYEVINYINTGLSADFFDEMPFIAQWDPIEGNTVEIYNTKTGDYEKINYLE